MSDIEVTLWRFDPEFDASPSLVKYSVPWEEGMTVLQALNHVYDEIDSTLAHGWGCRDKRCGLCGVEVNGKPRLGCLTKLKPGSVIRPLSKLPLVRDLMVDRSWLFSVLEKLELYIEGDPDAKELETLVVPPEYKRLMHCNECLCCLSACPRYNYDEDPLAGPFTYVKLAQLHFDPRDKKERKVQARSVGIEKCFECRQCYCALGIPIYSMAIAPLAAP